MGSYKCRRSHLVSREELNDAFDTCLDLGCLLIIWNVLLKPFTNIVITVDPCVDVFAIHSRSHVAPCYAHDITHIRKPWCGYLRLGEDPRERRAVVR